MWWQAHIDLNDVRVPESSRLPGANGFPDVAGVLVGTRQACAWMALGHAVAGFDIALTYATPSRAPRPCRPSSSAATSPASAPLLNPRSLCYPARGEGQVSNT